MTVARSHGIDIYYEMHGNPNAQRTIVFAHGMGGNAAIWFNQIVRFRGDFRIVTFDHRYFARSKCTVDDFDPAKFPDDILAIMSQEKITSAIFVCQSMGGWTGSQLAVSHPDKVDALIMSHTPGVFFHPSATNDPQDVARKVTAIGAESSPALAYDYPQKNPEGALLYQMISAFNGIDNAVIPQKINAAKLGVNTDSLQAYSVPTLFITGNLDILFPAKFIQSLAETLNGAKFENLGEVGHSSYFETPDAFNNAMAAFISDT
jgi:3-oxoadipate enol-lactonase